MLLSFRLPFQCFLLVVLNIAFLNAYFLPSFPPFMDFFPPSLFFFVRFYSSLYLPSYLYPSLLSCISAILPSLLTLRPCSHLYILHLLTFLAFPPFVHFIYISSLLCFLSSILCSLHPWVLFFPYLCSSSIVLSLLYVSSFSMQPSSPYSSFHHKLIYFFFHLSFLYFSLSMYPSLSVSFPSLQFFMLFFLTPSLLPLFLLLSFPPHI